MTALSADISCAICGGTTRRISAVCPSAPARGLGWENDSTLRVLNVERADVSVRICAACLHAFRTPKFDTEILYSDSAYQARKEAFEEGHPDTVYGAPADRPDWRRVFRGVGHEFARFARNTEVMCTSLDAGAAPDVSTVRILDWGGGDGAATNLYAQAIRLATGLEATAFIYDPAHPAEGSARLSREDIAKHAPYHIINMSHVLEHTHDPVGMLQTAYEYLAPAGLLIAEVPDERMNYARCAAGVRFGFHYHVAWFTRRSLERALARAGLGAVHADYNYNSAYHGRPMSVILGFGVKPRMGPASGRSPASRAAEIASFAVFVLRKVASRIGARIG